MICGFCNREFSEAQGEKNCQACSMFGGCKLVKCPYCGYEMPREAQIFKWLKRQKEKKNAT